METIKHLLPAVPRYFKANLHTHSTISDGKLSPTQVKDAYKAKGYQILAITDHYVITNHSQMNEPDFLMLTGVEINCNHTDYRSGFDGKSCHFNLIAKRPDNLWIPSKVWRQYPGGLPYEAHTQYEGMDINHETDTLNAIIAKANEKGFLVMYNHPTWSCHSYPDYAPLKGLWAMEVCNGECLYLGNNEHNARVYKDMLRLGNKLYPTGTDDMHHPEVVGSAWIMVGAETLQYDSVITALEKGDFYMSCGPEIHSLTISGNQLSITCSDARKITLETHGRFARRAAAENGTPIREATFDLTPFFTKAEGNDNTYIQLTVTAPDGSYAATRAYYLNELR